MRIILASQSIGRKRALDKLGIDYEVAPVNIDEKSIRDSDLYVMAEKITIAKAIEAGKKFNNSLIITGDLFTVFNGKVFEKPVDKQEAIEMLRAFSGNEVDMISAAAVYNTATNKLSHAVDSCSITFRKITEDEIQNYVDSYEVTRFAGAFESDASGILFGEKIKGNPTLMTTGFPFNKVIEFLRENGVKC